MTPPATLIERLARRGAASLEDAELLALLMGRRACGGLPRRVLARCRGVAGLFRAPHAEFGEPGGLAAWARLQAARELHLRSLAEPLVERPLLDNPAATEAWLRATLGPLEHELFLCLHLDNRHRLIRPDVLFRGTVDGASVYPREVVKSALAHNAAAVILAHNHPSGVAEPSIADEQITRRLKAALGLVDIRVLDHLVVAAGGCVSLAARGLL
jgi:DNA repair protein RadC